VSSPSWTFLSNHGHTLVALSLDPDARMRDVADRVGITERAVQNIVRDLTDAGYLETRKEGRRNHYRVVRDAPLRHPLESSSTVGALLALVTTLPD
jgi:DNA-binding Lrp family transcriptional regulator